ncbi:hypothetical protein [Desulfonatronum parangueonense]
MASGAQFVQGVAVHALGGLVGVEDAAFQVMQERALGRFHEQVAAERQRSSKGFMLIVRIRDRGRDW